MEERRSDSRRQEPMVARADGPPIPADESDDEFEFSFGSREPATGGATADELFADGRIRPFYPVFGRVFDDAHVPSAPGRRPLGRLFLEEARNSSVGSTSSSSSSAATDAGDLDGASPDTYCVWTPGASAASSPARSPRKSGSTGSLSRWRRVSELVVGRSRSDGRDKFRFLSAPPSPAREQPKGKPRGRDSKATTELDTVAAGHRQFYGAKASPGAARRTFLPYRQDLVGLFSTPKGLSRSQYF
ncbi:hypothetical protein CFC21_047391 [Triticum aestivum]|uniref:Uncharacterized protein n=3 Tax=Triticinae TaxID=1648030 RepID=A0A453F3R4_AEGTS|nr:uncharacterized protein LOC109758119 [Aegilops tauschii subsp. strangulata]XP_040259914.2 uncharacterized protein LOC120976713 [Aegilops tauschii subsp. strangulata]XP_044353304.1 uncharacterized protein LOC123074567 [Triticum aestivum]KAF7036869.1 hypothetical protein CFC21_047391 [Triticum aestivum]